MGTLNKSKNTKYFAKKNQSLNIKPFSFYSKRSHEEGFFLRNIQDHHSCNQTTPSAKLKVIFKSVDLRISGKVAAVRLLFVSKYMSLKFEKKMKLLKLTLLFATGESTDCLDPDGNDDYLTCQVKTVSWKKLQPYYGF